MAAEYQGEKAKSTLGKGLMWILLVLIIIVGGLSAGGSMYVYSQVKKYDEVFIGNVFVEEVYIGALTKEEAKEEISKAMYQKDSEKTITLYSGDKEWVIPYTEFEGRYNIEEVVDQAFERDHQGNIIEKFKKINNEYNQKTTFSLEYSYNKEAVNKVIQNYAPEFLVQPIDATMIRKDRKFIITPEQNGQKLDIDSTVEKFYTLCDQQEEGKVEAVIVPTYATITSSYFEQVQTPIASFYTSYNNADLNRNVNLAIGAKTINTVVKPNEVFELSKYLEPISAKNGYKSSKVIVNGKLVDGIGGGICQIASTLYNSVILTDLEVTQRQNHSLPVGYIPLGRDATYASNAIDFKFKNPTQYPVYIESYCENNRLYVNIFGHKSLKPDYEVKFESVTTEVIPAPATKYIDDPELPKGEKRQELAPIDGRKVTLYKYLYKDGKLIDKVVENNSYYRPRGGIVHVGTKEEVKETINPGEEPKNVEIEEEIPVIDDPSFMNLYEEQL